jgi:Holliday junction DNA helicase RuvA
MRDRISALGQMPASAPKSGASGARAEAYAALVALGYRPVEVNRLLQGVEQEGAGTEELIRRALQAAAR